RRHTVRGDTGGEKTAEYSMGKILYCFRFLYPWTSPEYIMILWDRQHRVETPAGRGRTGSCPWRPASPSPGTSSAGCRQRRSTPPGPRWWRPAETPSSLERET
uniref:Uncharacterized protein n=1 Tax=Gadus morhua TaxID=8049 RepID=A0A8C5CQR6_GADMO